MAINEAIKGKMIMDQKLPEYWTKLICPLFEGDYSCDAPSEGRDVKVKVAWVFDTDNPVRPKKVSNPLNIIIPWDTLIEYQGKPENWTNNADEKIIQFIKKNLEKLDPKNMEPMELIVPKEILY